MAYTDVRDSRNAFLRLGLVHSSDSVRRRAVSPSVSRHVKVSDSESNEKPVSFPAAVSFPVTDSFPETDGDKKSFPAAVLFPVTDSSPVTDFLPEIDGEEPTP